MRTSTAAIVGCIVGGLILGVGSVAVHAARTLDWRASPAAASGYDSPARERHSMATSVFDLCMAIGRPFGCEDFRFATTSAAELEAGNAIVSGRRVRIATYRDNDALLDAVAASDGKDRAGRKLTILVGGNWALTYPTAGDDPEHAQRLAVRMGGLWVDNDDVWKD